MAQSGIPSKGALVGYEIFDNSDSLGTSNFVQNVNLLRALEGELARTIGAFSNIDSARVHLVIPKKELFSREKQTPSASIILSMKGSARLSKEQINAVGHLVATAVPGLELSKITIVDTTGRSLKLGSKDENDPGMIASNSEDFRISYENRLSNTIEDLLEQSLGLGHVKAQVSAEINFDRIVTNYETFDPSSTVVRSVQEISDKGSSSEKGSSDNVSVAGSLPGGQGGADGSQNSNNNEHTDTTTNYEISKTIKNHISETGVVKRLSVAVLVDGIYNTDKKTGEVTYTPRTDQELKKYESLIKSAVGFDDSRGDKIEIVNMQFVTDLSTLAEESTMSWFKRELPNIVQTIVIGIVVILVLLLVVRPVALKAFEVTKEDLEEAENLEVEEAPVKPKDVAPPSVDLLQEPMIDIAKIEAKFKNNNSSKSINDIATKYPQETVNALRKWINNG
jgi:flagellar M-ring protein FliF